MSLRGTRRHFLGALTLCVCALAAARANADASVGAVRSATPPVIDGRLDDEIWKLAGRSDAFREVDPVEGGAPRQRTEIRVAYDDEALYVAVRCDDSDPRGIIAKTLLPDVDMRSDDRVNFVFDTFHDSRNGYFFQINPVSARSDALIENNAIFRREWDTIWYGKASVDATGWSAEIAIPFQSLTFRPDDPVWGFEVERIVRRDNQKIRWANHSQNHMIVNIAGIGRIEGLEGVSGTGVDVKPSYRAGFDRRYEPADDDWLGRPGLDVFYKPTSSITTVATFNTDFSDTPQDLRQTNLTRFPIMTPETRDFFLQDAGIFDFAGIVDNGKPFFSRRIGIVSGQDVPIDAGLKATGRVGDLNFGALSVLTGSSGGYDRESLTVARASLNVLAESSIGAIVTRGDPASREADSVAGIDLRYRDSSFGGSKIIAADFFAVGAGSGAKENAYGARIDYPNDIVNFGLAYQWLGDEYDPPLGFTPRTDVQTWTGRYRQRWRPKDSFLRTIDARTEGYVITGLDGKRQSTAIQLIPLDLMNNAEDRLFFGTIVNEERLDAPSTFFRNSLIPPGDYEFQRWIVHAETSLGRPVAGIAELVWGPFYNGSLYAWLARIELRPSPHLFFSLEYRQNEGRLDPQLGPGGELYDGNFTDRLVIANLAFAFTSTLSWTNLVQYDNGGKTIGINSRLRWEVESGRDVYLIWNNGWNADHQSVQPFLSQAFVKIAWTFRF